MKSNRGATSIVIAPLLYRHEAVTSVWLAMSFSRRYGAMAIELFSLTGLVITGDVIVQGMEQYYDHITRYSSSTSMPSSSSTFSHRPPSSSSSLNGEGVQHTKLIPPFTFSQFELDKFRTIGMGLAGFLWVGPLTMKWFPFLHQFMAKKMPHLIEGSLRYVLTKMALENACLAGPCCLGFFIIPSKIEGGERWSTLIPRLKTDFIPTLLTDIAFWTIFSPFNYKFIAVKFQPAVSCMLGGLEAGGLSYLTHLEQAKWMELFGTSDLSNETSIKSKPVDIES